MSRTQKILAVLDRQDILTMAQAPTPEQMKRAMMAMQKMQKNNGKQAGTIKRSMNVNGMIKTLRVLNRSNEDSTISDKEFGLNINKNDIKYIMSDADEELLILVEFKEEIDLDSITFFASSISEINPDYDDTEDIDYSPPKDISIYKIKNINKDFDDAKSRKPDFTLSADLNKISSKYGQIAKLKKKAKASVKFGKCQFLMIFISSNQDDTDQTYINAMQFRGINQAAKS